MRSATPHRGLARALAAPLGAIVLLVAIAALRFAFPHTRGIMLLSVVPIAILGMTLGLRGGLGGAVFASAVFLATAVWRGDEAGIEHVNHPLTFFLLGFVSGIWAHGALGDHDLHTATANRRLHGAIARGEVEMHYQPIVRAGGGGVIALEALARWRDPVRGSVPPLEFIPSAERDAGIIWALTLHTLELAAADAREWLGDDGLQVAVNISPSVLDRSDLPAAIAGVIRRHELPPNSLTIEVTETAVAEGAFDLAAALDRMREAGVGAIAIDDFGVGQSSFARFDRLPIDILKIDQVLVRRVAVRQTGAIIDAIVGAAHALDVVVVAEGVEDAETRTLLDQHGCDGVQGFEIARPMPPADVPGWLSQTRQVTPG